MASAPVALPDGISLLSKRGPSRAQVLLLAFVTVQALDGILSYVGVSLHGLDIEANPLVGWYLAALGPVGLREIASQNVRNAAYLIAEIERRGRHRVLFPSPRFNEFVLRPDDPGAVAERLERARIVGGAPLGRWFPELEGCLLVCSTEVHRKADLDALLEVLHP